MARPLTLGQLTAALSKWHAPFWVYPGAGTRGRPGGLTDMAGTVNHHTGGGSASASYLEFLFEVGRPDEGIPGPLCNVATDPYGVTIVGAMGRANHAGAGSSRTHGHVVAEDYSGYSSELEPGPDNLNGNPVYYGDEMIYSGTVPPSPRQYRGCVLFNAAVCDAHGWSALSVITHREHTDRKDDPFGVRAYQLRKDVAAVLHAGPATTVNYVATGKLAVSDTSTPATQWEDTVALSPEAITQIRAAVQAEEEEYANRFWGAPTGTGTALISTVRTIALTVARIEADTDALQALQQELDTLDTNLAILASRPAQTMLANAGHVEVAASPAPADTPGETA